MTLTQINKAGLDEIALDHVFTIGASGSSAYTFQGEGLNGTVNNPTLYLTRGKTYRFENVSGGHPIRIQSTSGASGTAYNTGVTNNAGSGTVIVEVQHDAPDVLYYQCTSHAAMNGILYITGALADGGVTTAKIADGAINSAKIADGTVATGDLTNNIITTAKLVNDSVTTSKIADSQVTTAKINDDAVTTAKIANNAVTQAKLADSSVGGAQMRDNAIATAEIQDGAVTLAKLENGTSSNDGKFLRANNGADPTFETVNTDLVSDTSPQLGGNLDSNGSNIKLGDSSSSNDDRLQIGAATFGDLELFHDGSNSYITNATNDLLIQNTSDDIYIDATDDIFIRTSTNEDAIKCLGDGAVELYYNNSIKFKTLTDGCQTVGKLGVGTSAPAKNIHVADSGATTVRIETTDSRGQAWDILSTNGAQNNTGTLSFRDESGSEYLGFGANGGSPQLTVRNGGSNNLLVVDNNGNVTKPSNPHAIIFTVGGNAGVANNKINNDYAVFTGVHLNRGSHYSTSTGRFTCPVDGVYGIAFASNMSLSNLSVGNNYNIQTRINGSVILYNYDTVYATGWQYMSFTNYVSANANDYLQIYYNGPASFGADYASSGQWGELYFWLVG